MLIGEVARRSGLAASTLRYYERAGLLPPPARSSKRRIYEPKVMARLRIIQLARDAGFTIAETRTFLSNYPAAVIPSVRWQRLADRKILEIDALIVRVTQMKTVLRSNFHCVCATIEDCERLILDSSRAAPESEGRGRSRTSRTRSSRRPWA
jgi:MerR family redox-sensitive transcriptional activator SoxR